MQRYNVCEIDLAAIRHNVGVMKSHIAGGAKFLAVVKADSAKTLRCISSWIRA